MKKINILNCTDVLEVIGNFKGKLNFLAKRLSDLEDRIYVIEDSLLYMEDEEVEDEEVEEEDVINSLGECMTSLRQKISELEELIKNSR